MISSSGIFSSLCRAQIATQASAFAVVRCAGLVSSTVRVAVSPYAPSASSCAARVGMSTPRNGGRRPDAGRCPGANVDSHGVIGFFQTVTAATSTNLVPSKAHSPPKNALYHRPLCYIHARTMRSRRNSRYFLWEWRALNLTALCSFACSVQGYRAYGGG